MKQLLLELLCFTMGHRGTLHVCSRCGHRIDRPPMSWLVAGAVLLVLFIFTVLGFVWIVCQ